MKTAVVFSVLAMMCFFETGDAANNAGTAAITRLKSTTTSTTNDLDRYGKKMISDLSLKLGNQKITALSNINNIVNPALNSIRSAINAAKESGKDAEHCYEPARQDLRQASYIDADKELDACKQNGVASLNPVKSNIDSAVLQGKRIVNELDAIAIGCISSNAIAYQNCIIAKIPNASQTVQGFQSTAELLKNTGNSQSSCALTTGFGCNENAVQKVRQATTDVRATANSCIANS